MLYLTLLGIIAILVVTKLYSDKNRKLPSASTSKGRQARILLDLLIIFTIGTLIIDISNSDRNASYWIFIIGGGLALTLFRYISYKKAK
jgi:hypothetical protein